MDTPLTITCGTDLSDNAIRASHVAAALARMMQARLELVHVVEDLGAELAFQENQVAPYEPHRRQLEAEASDLRARHGVDVNATFAPGIVEELLIQHARASHSRLIVVAALGRSPRPRWLLGSVAERVAQLSPLPVLIVRDGEGLIAWAAGKRPLSVVVGVDLGAASRAALNWVGDLRQAGPCDVSVVRVLWPPEEHRRLGVPPPVALEGLHPTVARVARRETRRWVGELPGSGQVSLAVTANWGRVDVPLLAEAGRWAADLVVVGTHQRSGMARAWHGSVSRQVVHEAHGDVVTVPSGAAGRASASRFERVLAATDFSDAGNRAVAVAYGLVPPRGVVHLTHVTDPGLDTAVARVRERLAALVPPDADASGVVTVLEVVDAEPPGDAILQLASRRGVDAICLGGHGRRALAPLVLGSVAQRVLQHSRCPVVIVPPEWTTPSRLQ